MVEEKLRTCVILSRHVALICLVAVLTLDCVTAQNETQLAKDAIARKFEEYRNLTPPNSSKAITFTSKSEGALGESLVGYDKGVRENKRGRIQSTVKAELSFTRIGE